VAAIIISIVLMVIAVIVVIAIVVPLVIFAQETVQACSAVDFSGTVTVRGVEVTCTPSMR
jgi:hypothetical protein